MYFLDFQMRSFMNWLSKMLESMATAFFHPVKNDLPPSIGAHAYYSSKKENAKKI